MPEIQATFEAVFTVIDFIITALGEILTAFTDSAAAIWEVWGGLISESTEENFNLIKDTIDSVLNIIKGLIELATGIMTGDWDTALKGLEKITENSFKVIKNLVQLSVNGIVTIVKGIGTALYNAGKDIFNSLLSGIKSAWSNITSFVNDKIDWIQNKVSGIIGKVQTAGSHRTGLEYVPYDGYIAELHKGEMVLTQAEAQRYKDDESGGTNTVNNITYAPVLNVGSVRSDKDIKEVGKALDRNIKNFERAIGRA